MAKQRAIARHIPLEPIKLGSFTLTETGMEVHGKPAFSEYQGVGDFISRAHKSSGWWVADWLAYGETRDDWKEKLQAVLDVTQYDYETAMNLKNLGENVPRAQRRADVHISKHFLVQKFNAREREEWLEKTAENGWSYRDLKQQIRAAERTKVIAGQAVLEGMYRVLNVDCPWIYDDSGATDDGSLGKAERHYEGMTIEELCNLPVKAHTLPDSVMGFWITAPMIYDKPGPRDVIDAWGFRPVTHYIWDKVLGNPGHYGNHVTHELFFICVRGNCLPDVPTPQTKTVITIKRPPSFEHSEKPPEFRQILERHWTLGKRLELFARRRVPGWDCFGNDARLWAEQSKLPANVKEEEVPF